MTDKNKYQPLSPPMTGKGSSTAIKQKSADRRFREEIILTTTVEWIKSDPDGVREYLLDTRAQKAAQRKNTGSFKGKNRANMYVKYRMPQILLDCIRLALRWAEDKYDMEFEVFGMDDKDMKLVVQKFPDLFRYSHNMQWNK